ncbi:PREDICTED: matrilin-3-like [Propithecus coquereli]|uniref:matrilin-3-like n=1 Tax=Propithecus coquereli TaxID=379532 RepID=UPI00063F37AF|nr:PREDICTED: matrilin-3-like [Propithecus coquereli]
MASHVLITFTSISSTWISTKCPAQTPATLSSIPDIDPFPSLGFTVTVLNPACLRIPDINECTIDNAGCQDQCCNTIGSYYCTCQASQTLAEDGRGCDDVDECAVVNGGCQQRCINTLGTFHCECATGYRLHADERTCIKMDPCTGGNGCAHICQSENGMARCACHPGYQLSEDKKTCEGRKLKLMA